MATTDSNQSAQPEIVSETLFDKNAQITTDPDEAVTGNVIIRMPDGSLQFERIVKPAART